MRLLHLRLAPAACVLALLAAPLSATWSIVLVNHDTGEVGVASATCLPDVNLKFFVPVVWVGAGAGAAQSVVDSTGFNRQILFDGLQAGKTPEEIKSDLLTMGLTPGQRQYGIAAFSGPAATFTGGAAGAAAHGVTGRVGPISYAIQGNLLTGGEVVLAAEAALRSARGDTVQRMIAAMLAARELGGDGRCSCDAAMPTSCGVPPASFEKSAHVGFFIVARMGDRNGTCSSIGCATGPYYYRLNVIGSVQDPDPVLRLHELTQIRRANLRGRPDGIHSWARTSASSLPADGRTGMTVHLKLRDVEDEPLTRGRAEIGVAPADPSATPLVRLEDVTDHGDGAYELHLVALGKTGTQELAITADDGFEKATLYPFPTVRLDPVTGLHAGEDEVSAASGGSVPLTVNLPAAANGPYMLFASASGTQPGVVVGDAILPLNPDELFQLVAQGDGGLFGAPAFLDGRGYATARWVAPPMLLAPLLGTEVSWAGLAFHEGSFVVTNVVTVDVVL